MNTLSNAGHNARILQFHLLSFTKEPYIDNMRMSGVTSGLELALCCNIITTSSHITYYRPTRIPKGAGLFACADLQKSENSAGFNPKAASDCLLYNRLLYNLKPAIFTEE